MTTQKIPGRLIQTITTIVVILAIIGITVVVRRSLALAGVIKPRVNPKFGAFDSGLQINKALTFVHIIPGALFMILAPLQFVPGIRARHLWFHRFSGRILVVLGLIIGITAL